VEEVKLTKKQQKQLDNLLAEYTDIFKEVTQLPPERSFSHKIELQDGAQPPWVRVYRMTPEEDRELKTQLKKLLELGFVEKANSPFGAGCLFVKKTDGSLRLCIDYRHLNKLTVADKYPLTRIDELLDDMRGSSLFSKLDLTSGYWQVLMDKASVHKTAFNTRYGSFQ
jgi:hypothetical protein